MFSLKTHKIIYSIFSDFDRIATATSDNTIHIFDLNQQKGLSQLTQLNVDAVNGLIKGDICGIKFAKNNANLIFVSSTVGEIHSFDIRTPDATVQKFECDDAQRKPFTCFDVNSNDTILCAGTEEQLSEAYLIYFDIRKNVTLGAYTDSHKNDVTQVKFHPNKHNLIASGSTDGLINVFDIVQTSEDDALEYCLNTESSVQTINWHTTGTDTENRLTCITDTNDFQLFNVEDSELMLQFDRSAITDSIKRKSAIDCYLVNCHTSINNEIILLAGSNSNRGECLRSLTLCKDQLEARNNFRNNKQIVRCSLFNNKVI